MVSHSDSRPTLGAGQTRIPAGHPWQRLPWIGLAAGGAGLVVSLLLGAGQPEQFYFSWLTAFLFWLSLALGAQFFVLSHFVSKASWSVVVRRLAENVMAALPLFALLFVPILVGLDRLFPWADPAELAHHPLPPGKERYLNPTFFIARAAIYLAAWSIIAAWIGGRSRRQDQTGEVAITLRLIRHSAPALVLFAVTVSFAAVDWIMSLDPHWYSTIFGVYYFAGCVVGCFALLVVLAAAMRRAGLLSTALTVEHFHDLGKLLFAFTVFWAYIAFSQYFLIWYGNIPEETVFYLHRAEGSWRTVSVLLGAGHFGAPFLFLMPRTIKRRTGLLVLGAVWMLGMHFVDLHWLVMPALHPHGLHPSLLDLSTLVAIGGLFAAVVGWRMRAHALLPIRDPRLDESLTFENV
jgi:hypothetical protein